MRYSRDSNLVGINEIIKRKEGEFKVYGSIIEDRMSEFSSK